MTHIPDETAALAALRRSLEPSAADRARIFEKARERAARGAYPAIDFAPPPANVGALGVSRALIVRTAAWWLGAAVLAGVSAGSYALGFSAGQRVEASRVDTMRVPSPKVTRMAIESGFTPALPVIAPAPTLPSTSRPMLPPAASSPLPAPSQSLEAELRALRRIERALRDRNPLLARALLQELDRVVPGGKLADERAVAEVVAVCQLEPSAAKLREFGARYPGSLHLERVKRECVPGTAPTANDKVEAGDGL
jgi:hypothetical protein